MAEYPELKGKRVLVSGSGTGIGRGLALAFAQAGADVAVHYSHSAAGAAQVVAACQALGVRAAAFPADFTSVAAVQDLARAAIGFLGGIDVLVNNAGITMNRAFTEVREVEFDTLYAVNIRALFFLTQAAVRDMLPRGRGCVINISSVHAFEGMPEHSVYAGTKGAIVTFTRQLAVELAPQGVRVNAIAPGAVEVENFRRSDPQFDPAAVGRTIPAGFIGQPADVGAVALFLASDAARYVVGQTWIVDGGTTAWMPFGDGFRQRLRGTFGRGYVPGIV